MADNLFADVADPEQSERPKEPGYTSPKTLADWKMRLRDYMSTTQERRKKSELNFKYYDGDQLTADELSKLEERGQPDVVINRFRVAINGILGVVSRSRTDPRAYPRTPGDEDASDVATDCLRYVTQRNRFKFTKVQRMKEYLLGGTCAILVGVNEDGDPDLIPIRWEEFFADPRSRSPDYSDARYMGLAKWMYADEVKGMKDDDSAFSAEIDAAIDTGQAGGLSAGNGSDDTFDDRPTDQGWIDTKTKRLMVVEIYERCKGTWHFCKFWEGGIIEEGISPYLDDKKRPCNPIAAQSCYVTIDNERMGYGDDLRPIQDEINKRRSKALWEVSSSQIEASDPSAIEVEADNARIEAARPDGVIPYGWKKVSGTDKSAGNMALLSEAKNEMERFSPNQAMLGRQGSDTSGRALLARQQAGLVELAVPLDQFEDWELRVYMQIWYRCKQYWTEPMWIRVTDDIEDPRFVGLNQPKVAPPVDPAAMAPEGPGMGMGAPPVAPMGSGMAPSAPPVDPATMMAMAGMQQMGMEAPPLDGGGQPVLPSAPPMDLTGVLGYDNVVAEMDVDIMLDTVPETATIMAEQLTELRNMVSSNPQYAQEVPFEVMLEMTALPRKRQLIKKIQAHKEAMQKAAQEQQAKEEAKQDAALQAELALTASETRLNDATGAAKTAAAEQGAIRTATQADKTLSGVETEEARTEMAAIDTALKLTQATDPAAGGQSGDTE